MAEDELSSIPGLLDKHRKVLAEQLQVTTCHGLVLTQRRAIFDAMGRIRPRPTLEVIAEWQDHARTRLSKVMPVISDWDRAATFVVSFEQRPGDQGGERRLAVEQTEIEPEQPPQVWPGWDCQRICDWMLDRLGLAQAVQPESPTTTGAGRPQLRIDRATIIDEAGRVDIVTDNMLPATSALGCTVPGRLVVTVSGSDPDREVHVVIRFRRPGTRSRSAQEPVVVQGAGQADFDLSHVAVGQYGASLVAWTPDGSANPRVVELPGFTIRVPAVRQAPVPADAR